jgi:hypothetical protein
MRLFENDHLARRNLRTALREFDQRANGIDSMQRTLRHGPEQIRVRKDRRIQLDRKIEQTQRKPVSELSLPPTLSPDHEPTLRNPIGSDAGFRRPG